MPAPSLTYIVNGRLPTEKAHGYQILQTCQGFLNSGAGVTVAYPDRRTRLNEDAGQGLVAYYGLQRDVPATALPCIDGLGWDWAQKPWASPVHTPLFHLQTWTFFLSLRRWLLRQPEDSVIYLRDLKIAYMLHRLLPARRAARLVLETHALPTDAKRLAMVAALPTFVTVTAYMKTQLVDAGVDAGAVHVAPDAVDDSAFQTPLDKAEARRRLGWPQDRRVAAFIGKFHTNGNEKGIPEILKTVRPLCERFPDLDFRFVGGPLDREPGYRAILEAEGAPQNRVFFGEKVPVTDVPVHLWASDILLMPHPHSHFYAYHVSPLKMFEYMAAERPIVGSALPAIEEVLMHGGNALLGEAGSPDAIGRNIAELLDNPDRAAALAAQARRDVAEHTWTRRAARILDFIEARGLTGPR